MVERPAREVEHAVDLGELLGGVLGRQRAQRTLGGVEVADHEPLE
jgi:hypothetical protein